MKKNRTDESFGEEEKNCIIDTSKEHLRYAKVGLKIAGCLELTEEEEKINIHKAITMDTPYVTSFLRQINLRHHEKISRGIERILNTLEKVKQKVSVDEDDLQNARDYFEYLGNCIHYNYSRQEQGFL